MHYVVCVDDAVEPRLAGDRACSYTSPPQPWSQAAELVRVLTGYAEVAGEGPWWVAIAGGRRTVTALPAHPDGQLMIEAGQVTP